MSTMDVLQPELEFFIVADSVESVNNKLYMLGGGFSNINSPTYPCPMNFGIAIGLLVPTLAEPTEHELNIDLIYGDSTLQSIKAKLLQKGSAQVGSKKERAIFATNLGIELQQPGTYSFRASCGSTSKEVIINALLIAGQH